MPTRSYYFPDDFAHLSEILHTEIGGEASEIIEHFRSINLPPVYSTGTLAVFLGISPKIIFSIRRNPRNHYRTFFIKKRSGKWREISSPRTYLKVIQWWIVDNILSKQSMHDFVFGFIRGRGIIDNAKYHASTNHILNMDIRDFFPSVESSNVQSIFARLGFSIEVAELFSELCCLNGRLPQGAPTSPILANLAFSNIDTELHELAQLSGMRYSRYADDLTFSCKEHIETDFVKKVKDIVEFHDFKVNDEKTRFCGPGDRLEVTGVVINEKLQPPRKWRKITRAKLHKLSYADRIIRRDIDYINGLRGIALQYPESVNMQSLAKFGREIYEKLRWTVVGMSSTPLLPNGLSVLQAEALAALKPRKTNLAIANELGISEAAFKKRLQQAFKKVGLESRAQAFHWAQNNL